MTARNSTHRILKTIQCDFVQTLWKLFVKHHETCSVDNQVIDGFGFVFTAQNDQDYKFITMNDITVNFLPENISEAFPNLQGLEVIRSSLSLLRAENLKNLTELVELNLSNNKLDFIGKNVFKDLEKVELVMLRSNKIQFIHDKAFRNMEAVRQIILENNELTEIRQRLFSNNKKLETIRLSGNQISVIDPMSFSGLNMLSILDIRRNTCINEDFLLVRNFNLRANFTFRITRKIREKCSTVVELETIT